MFRNLGPLIGAIDQGTSSSRFLVFSANTAELITYYQIPVKVCTPKDGWVEIDPTILIDSVVECVDKVTESLKELDIDPLDVVAIGITNQRETTILWDSTTGLPLCNAIIWSDTRTQDLVESYSKLHFSITSRSGLPISTYFSALKIKWLIDNVKEVQEAIREKRCLFGTVDTWLLWKLTGVHATDVTNASRTNLMNLENLNWDLSLCHFFSIPSHILPSIRSSSEIYGTLKITQLSGVPVSGILGDQQASLVGHHCFQRGQIETTIGTGCFVLMNVGTSPIYSSSGLVSTVAFQFGPESPPYYALEGSIASGGQTLNWLESSLTISNVFDKASLSTFESNDVIFVPAFSGLLSPHWKTNARGLIMGLSSSTQVSHICRSALEAIGFQIREILEALISDTQMTDFSSILVSGGLSNSDLLCQILADISGLFIRRPSLTEITSLGVAIAAGRAKGIEVWDLELNSSNYESFTPSLHYNEVDVKFEKWKKAVERSFDWIEPKYKVSKATRNLESSLPGTLFCFLSLLLYGLSVKLSVEKII